MRKWELRDAEELIKYLDRRIDSLTKPLPSSQLLRLAEGIVTAGTDSDTPVSSYNEDDYGSLLDAYEMLSEYLPEVLRQIRVQSIDPNSGWKLKVVDAGQGDVGACALCRRPFQHFKLSVQVHHLDSHPDGFHGVCRECVRQHAPIEFLDKPDVAEWLAKEHGADHRVGLDKKREEQRIGYVDAIRAYTSSDRIYFSDLSSQASEWSEDAYGEWR